MMTNLCPLCESANTVLYTHTNDKDFFRCKHCDLIFVTKPFLLSIADEKRRYDQHQNDLMDAGYKSFLNQIVSPVTDLLPKGSKGLDFGSGPYPALVSLLEEASYEMDYFDPIYHTNQAVFDKKYQFITLTEVVEHFFNPKFELERLEKMLLPHAYLFIMTHRTDHIADFDTWYYKNDDTHVCFYSDITMNFIAKKYHLTLKILSERLVILRKT